MNRRGCNGDNEASERTPRLCTNANALSSSVRGQLARASTPSESTLVFTAAFFAETATSSV